MITKPILTTEELAAHLADPAWVVMDCRFDLSNPAWGEEEYRRAHIPGSGYAQLDRDLSAPKTAQTGRHPLPPVEQLAARFGAWGISNDSQVVVYDTSGGAYAGRLWWLLRFLGHQAVALLDGGLQKWQAEGRPVASGAESRPPAQFVPRPDWGMVADAEAVNRIRQDAAYRLVDARAPERFRGEKEPIDPVAGHIPGAVNRFQGANLSPEGVFLPPETLREQFLTLLGDVPPQRAVVYCGSGVTAIHHLIAMEHAGLPGARLYPGSWSEWITDPKRPTAK